MMNIIRPTSVIVLALLLLILFNSCQKEASLPSAYNPTAASYNTQLGLAYLTQGNRQRAKQKLMTALTQDPNSPYTHDALAYYFEMTQDPKLAEQYYQKAIQLSPKMGAMLNNYATFLCRQARYSEALYYFEKAIADPHYINSAQTYENAGLCAIAAHHCHTAKTYLQKAQAEDPSLPSIQIAEIMHLLKIKC